MFDGGGYCTAFPVTFFDGEREMNIGDIQINPGLEYKPFQHMLSQKIGISPNQISIYLVDRKKNPTSPFAEDRRRIPITGKVNFGLICRQKECCFLVVLKRSRKTRNRRERMVEFGDYLQENDFSPPPAVNPSLILLRRNETAPFYDQITRSGLDDLNGRLQRLRFERENYQMAMEMMTKNEFRANFCEECVKERKNRDTSSFHPCVNDAVITNFVPRFGPITRPVRNFGGFFN